MSASGNLDPYAAWLKIGNVFRSRFQWNLFQVGKDQEPPAKPAQDWAKWHRQPQQSAGPGGQFFKRHWKFALLADKFSDQDQDMFYQKILKKLAGNFWNIMKIRREFFPPPIIFSRLRSQMLCATSTWWWRKCFPSDVLHCYNALWWNLLSWWHILFKYHLDTSHEREF